MKEIDIYFTIHHLTLAVAERVTAGYIQYSLTKEYQTTAYFEGGGCLCYKDEAQLLDIAMDALQVNEAVNPEVAIQMTVGINRLMSTDIRLGITGFAHLRDREAAVTPYAFLAIVYQQELIGSFKILARSLDAAANQTIFPLKSPILLQTLQNFNIQQYEKLFAK